MIYFIRIVHFIVISTGYVPILFIFWAKGYASNQFTVFGKHFTNYLEVLGPGFIKAGQIFASRPDIFNSEVRAQLGRLHSRARPIRRGKPWKQVYNSLGIEARNKIDHIDQHPIGSGSVAQVYKGRLKDGSLVAFKIANKKLVRNMIADNNIALFFAKFLDRSRLYESVPFADSLMEIKELIENQADLSLEAENLTTIRRNLAHLKYIIIPKVYEAISNDDILTMEYIDNFIEAKKTEDIGLLDYDIALKEGLTALYQMIFANGFVHADLHSGNVGFSNNSLVLLDFGIVAKLTSATKKDFGDFFYGFVIGDANMCLDIILRQSNRIPENFDQEEFYRKGKILFDQYDGLNVNEFQISGFVADLFSLQNDFRIKGSKDFVKVIFSILTFEGILKSFIPTIDFQLEAKLFLLDYRAKSFPRRPWSSDVYSTLNEKSDVKAVLI